MYVCQPIAASIPEAAITVRYRPPPVTIPGSSKMSIKNHHGMTNPTTDSNTAKMMYVRSRIGEKIRHPESPATPSAARRVRIPRSASVPLRLKNNTLAQVWVVPRAATSAAPPAIIGARGTPSNENEARPILLAASGVAGRPVGALPRAAFDGTADSPADESAGAGWLGGLNLGTFGAGSFGSAK